MHTIVAVDCMLRRDFFPTDDDGPLMIAHLVAYHKRVLSMELCSSYPAGLLGGCDH